MKNFKKLCELFVVFFLIGLFTFGGGYAMITLIEREIVEKKKWLSSLEMKDVLTIAESTPGPISVNTATYVGYKVSGVLGAAVATIALAIPSLVIIFVISLFINDFLKNEIVAKAFQGIKIAVVILVINAAFKLKKNVPNRIVFIILIIISMALTILFDIFSLNISSIYLIICGALIGLSIEFFFKKKEETK